MRIGQSKELAETSQLDALRERREKFFLALAEICDFWGWGSREAPVFKAIQRQVAAPVGCTVEVVGNVLRAKRNFHAESVSALRRWAVEKNRAAAKLDFDCLLSPDNSGKGTRRSRTNAPQVVTMKAERLQIILPPGYRFVLLGQDGTGECPGTAIVEAFR